MGGVKHRDLPLQHLTTGEGLSKQTAALHIEELIAAGIEQTALIIRPGTAPLFQELMAHFGSAIVLIEQSEPRGFGHALLCAEQWIDGQPFVLQLCDHVFITYAATSCTRQLIEVAHVEKCAVSGVQSTSESQLPYFGVIGGHRLKGQEGLFAVDCVFEKPTPTVAEERCLVSGMRQGTYLGFFGVHALTPGIFRYLKEQQAQLPEGQLLGLSESLASLLCHERYLALEVRGHRVDLESPFGILRAQLSLALHGTRRAEVLRLILEEAAQSDPSVRHTIEQ
jgi:UTP--glucose-1-phosphate uridylyltransferase